jgi:hypothetical protein
MFWLISIEIWFLPQKKEKDRFPKLILLASKNCLNDSEKKFEIC